MLQPTCPELLRVKDASLESLRGALIVASWRHASVWTHVRGTRGNQQLGVARSKNIWLSLWGFQCKIRQSAHIGHMARLSRLVKRQRRDLVGWLPTTDVVQFFFHSLKIPAEPNTARSNECLYNYESTQVMLFSPAYICCSAWLWFPMLRLGNPEPYTHS